MPYNSTFETQIPVACCSMDNVNYTIFSEDHFGNPYMQNVVRTGNTLPRVTFANFWMGYSCCQVDEATLNIDGVIGEIENAVVLTLSCNDIEHNGFGPGSFSSEVTVPLTLGGVCPPGNPFS